MEPQLDINAKRQIVQQEFARRASGQMPSSAGIGAETTNDPNLGMPTQQMTNPPAMQGGAAGTPSQGTMAAAKQQKGEARTLVDAMINRLKKLSERGE